MAKNNEMQPVANQGWLQGLNNLTDKENRRWWRSSQWWIQILIWLAVVNGLLAMILWVIPEVEAQQAGSAAPAQTEKQLEDPTDSAPSDDILGMIIFFSVMGIAPAVGVVILGSDALIHERQTGIAAWVLSKPVSRSAYVLSKLGANSLGILVTMVLAQGVVAYAQVALATGRGFAFLPALGALGLAFVSLFFWLALTLMLGSLINSRGGAIGIPLVLIFGRDLFLMLAPWLDRIMPWALTSSGNGTQPALAMALLQGQALPWIDWLPLFATLAWSGVFVAVTLWRFQRVEF